MSFVDRNLDPKRQISMKPEKIDNNNCSSRSKSCDVVPQASSFKEDLSQKEAPHRTSCAKQVAEKQADLQKESSESYCGSERVYSEGMPTFSKSNSAWDTGHPRYVKGSVLNRRLQFYRTKMCPREVCQQPDRCLYAHKVEDLRPAPNLAQTRLCPNVVTRGKCSESRCLFAHTLSELKSTDNLYKTSLCKFWRLGFCTSGDACRHAHGEEDVRDRPARVRQHPVDVRYNNVDDDGGRHQRPNGVFSFPRQMNGVRHGNYPTSRRNNNNSRRLPVHDSENSNNGQQPEELRERGHSQSSRSYNGGTLSTSNAFPNSPTSVLPVLGGGFVALGIPFEDSLDVGVNLNHNSQIALGVPISGSSAGGAPPPPPPPQRFGSDWSSSSFIGNSCRESYESTTVADLDDRVISSSFETVASSTSTAANHDPDSPYLHQHRKMKFPKYIDKTTDTMTVVEEPFVEFVKPPPPSCFPQISGVVDGCPMNSGYPYLSMSWPPAPFVPYYGGTPAPLYYYYSPYTTVPDSSTVFIPMATNAAPLPVMPDGSVFNPQAITSSVASAQWYR